MKQITHTIDNKEYIFVEVPKDAYVFYLNYEPSIGKPAINIRYKKRGNNGSTYFGNEFNYPIDIISTLSNISEEDAENLVEFVEANKFEKYSTPHYYDYTNTNKWEYTDSGTIIYGYRTAKESLQSLITSLGLTGEILILEKLN